MILSKEFPALTLRRTGIKSCVDEILMDLAEEVE